MEYCETCKYWNVKKAADDFERTEIVRPLDPVTFMPLNDADIVRLFGFQVKYCNNPDVKFFERPSIDGCCIVDASEYYAKMITGPMFGCVGHKEREITK